MNRTIPESLFLALVASAKATEHLGGCCLHESTHASPAFGQARRLAVQAMHEVRKLDDMRTNGPAFKHWCDKCEYITSTFAPDGQRHDWYYCDQAGLGDTVVCRKSNEPSDYSSYPAVIIKNIADCTAEDSCGRRALVPELMLAMTIYGIWQRKRSVAQVGTALAAEEQEHAP